ncbi:MAG: hypothetical protein EA390_01370 [Balneolaceae bacterium]|nr:MAG: hypothetical protein EA390_01370 [Balneolaceae bacterium]
MMLKSGLDMAPEFIRLLLLEKFRSLSFGRDIVSGLLVFVFISFILFYLVGLAVFLGLILRSFFEVQDVPAFLNKAAVFYLLAEFLIRFIIQKKPLFSLNNYLHLPIKKSGIINYLLVKSLFSPFSLLVIILFVPVTISDINPVYGPLYSSLWLATLFFFSIALHFLVLWLKEVNKERLLGTVFLFAIPTVPFVLLYFDVINIGEIIAPFFGLSSLGPLPLFVSMAFCVACYKLIHRQYLVNAYLDRVAKQDFAFMSGAGKDLFSRFGAAGTYADMELKLILRHKKSRGYLILSLFFLLYGLFMYRMASGGESLMEASGITLFVGIFMISIFFINYGQFFLSWNSNSFDFFMVKQHGLEALIRGKLLILIVISFFLYLLSLPYVYFGWQIVIFHTVALLYNVGIGIHVIARLSMWEPKPMDINKGAMFNYEGIGVSQFLMGIPFFVLPYVIYVPVNFLFDPYAALAAVGLFGITGIVFYKKMISYNVRQLQVNRHKISSRFRQGT